MEKPVYKLTMTKRFPSLFRSQILDVREHASSPCLPDQSRLQGKAKIPGPSLTTATRVLSKAISMDGLPEELFADILGRLLPRNLAACRSVCHDWRAQIDARGMLLAVADLVPRRMRGIYIHQVSQQRSYAHTCFFSREPAASPGMIDAALRFMPRDGPLGSGCVLDHRNGLLLYINVSSSLRYVCNPATRRWIELPAMPFDGLRLRGSEHLVFDPIVSLHYDVLFFPEPPREHGRGITKHAFERLFQECPSLGEDWAEHGRVSNYALASMAWPPVSYPVQVFSSRTGQWEEKRFTREDDTAVTVSDVWSDALGWMGNMVSYRVGRYHAVYWREALYLHCFGGFILRFSLQKETYLVIKTPKLVCRPRSLDSDERKKVTVWRVYLGKSQQGIYYTALSKNQLRVWVLREAADSRTVLEWELIHHADLKPSFSQHYARRRIEEKIDESWNLDRVDQKGCIEDRGGNAWDSDNDSAVDIGGGEDGEGVGSISDYWRDQCAKVRTDLLGFHARKEIAFFGKRFDGFAYYLSSSKLQYLGSFRPDGCYHKEAGTYRSFIYTPCMYDMLPLREEDENQDEDDEDDDGDEDDDDDDDGKNYDHEDDDGEEEDDEDIHWI